MLSFPSNFAERTPMAWIETIPFSEAAGRLRQLYERVKGPDGKVDNILKLHALRPHTLEGHMKLYKNVLHHSGNTLPKWFLETLGVYVSQLNACEYCVQHHFAGLRRLLDDDARAEAIWEAIEQDRFEGVFDARERSALAYARALTQHPPHSSETLIREMRARGYGDGEILEINQVTAYFAYANRTVIGLGATTEGDVLGLSPGDGGDPENWTHG